MTHTDIEITAELVRDLLRDQHPDLADRPVRFGARGWDNQLWRLGDDLAVRLPWATQSADAMLRKEHANAYAERFVLTVRSEVTDRMLILGQRQLRTALNEYARHYNGRRPHRGRPLKPPRPDLPITDLSQERIKRRTVLGGLINEYERAG
ncbi:integrase core domain-containing protein [Streptomyces sp. NPDC021212]|uniref:integrase core domain-containing protein n=1 Tax=Streptomyces sp. NPDC021212 TaxID=3365118 RepID=UPI0037BA936E